MLLKASEIIKYLGLVETPELIYRVGLLIPGAIETGISRTLNEFKSNGFVIQNNNFTFSASENTVSDSTGDFVDYYYRESDSAELRFYEGDIIKIEDSLRNNGYRVVAGIDDNVMTLGSGVQDEAEDAWIKIWKIDLPEDFKIQVAAFIAAYLQINFGFKSEGLGNTSMSYQTLDEAAKSIFHTRKKFGFR